MARTKQTASYPQPSRHGVNGKTAGKTVSSKTLSVKSPKKDKVTTKKVKAPEEDKKITTKVKKSIAKTDANGKTKRRAKAGSRIAQMINNMKGRDRMEIAHEVFCRKLKMVIRKFRDNGTLKLMGMYDNIHMTPGSKLLLQEQMEKAFTQFLRGCGFLSMNTLTTKRQSFRGEDIDTFKTLTNPLFYK